MTSAIVLLVVARSPLGSRFDKYVRAAQKEKKPIMLVATDPNNDLWQKIQRTLFSREDVRRLLQKVLILKLRVTDELRPKIAKACRRRFIRIPTFGFFDYDGNFITILSGNVGVASFRAAITNACAVAAGSARRRAPKERVWRKADTTPQSAKLRIAEMYIKNNEIDAARQALDVIAAQFPGTPEAEKAASYLIEIDAGRKPQIASSRPAVSGDPARELRMARMLIMNKAPDAAREKLQSIVSGYPGTPEAEDAQNLLSELQ